VGLLFYSCGCENCFWEEIRRKLNLGNGSYNSVQNPLSFCLPSIDMKVKIYRIIIFPVILFGCEICFFALREEHRLRMFENRVLRRIFGPKRVEII
jgi:hypothetical protein